MAALNPCPCGQRLRGPEYCRCSPGQVRRYFGKISGPLLDRIDLVLPVPRRRGGGKGGECADIIRARIAGARKRLAAGGPVIDREGTRWLDRQLDSLDSSYRLRFKIRKLAITLAALEGAECASRENLLEALDLGLETRRRILSELDGEA